MRLTSAAVRLTSKRLRPWLAAIILLVTLTLVARFFIVHPQYLSQLKSVHAGIIIGVVLLYIPMLAILVGIYDATLKLCGKRLELKENVLLTSYSSIINFFGPLQSGPGVRAVYLKARHQIRLRDYTLATLVYYGLFAFFSALFLLVGNRPWWQTVLALIAVASISYLAIRRFMRRRANTETQFGLRTLPLMSLAVATFAQVFLSAVIYFFELHAVNPSVHFGQAISYAGAANFSLFVSLTPGAIGFRETFLVFSQNLHHVSTSNILAASIIDRGAYIIFLGLLFIFVISVHAKDKLRIRSHDQLD